MTAREGMEKSRYVRVIEWEEVTQSNTSSPTVVESTFSFPEGVMAIEVTQN